jgi:hypothetical protein
MVYDKPALRKPSCLDLFSVRSLKQQSADRHVALLGHIILIPIISP